MDNTIFHAQGGGQPKDEGTMHSEDAEFEVEDITINGDHVSHVGKFKNLDNTFKVDQEVEQKIDGQFRKKCARIHSAGHLIDMAMEKTGYGHLEPGKGFHFPKGSYVEYIGVVDNEKREKLVEDLNTELKTIIDEVKEEDAMVAKVYSYEEAKETLGSVPPFFKEGSKVRIVKLCKDDKGCPCGGTHVKHIKDIKNIQVSKIQKKKKNTRICYDVLDE